MVRNGCANGRANNRAYVPSKKGPGGRQRGHNKQLLGSKESTQVHKYASEC